MTTKENSECFSPWSTRSFGATTGGIRANKEGAGGKGKGAVGKGKRSPLSASQNLRSAAGAETHVLPLPPWRGGEGGSELDATLTNAEQGRKPWGDKELYNIFNDNDHDNDHEQIRSDHRHPAATPTTWVGEGGQAVAVGRGSFGNYASEQSKYRRPDRRRRRSTSTSTTSSNAWNGNRVDEDRDRRVARDKGMKAGAAPARQNRFPSGSAAQLEGASAGGGGSAKEHAMEDFVLTDCSSDDDSGLAFRSPQTQGKLVGVTDEKESRLRNERPRFSSESAGGSGSPEPKLIAADWRHHSSGPTPAVRGGEGIDNVSSSSRENLLVFSERYASGGRRVSDTPRSSRPGQHSASAETGSGASIFTTPGGRQQFGWMDDEANRDASAWRQGFRDQTGPHASNASSVELRGGAPPLEQSPSPRSNASIGHQPTGARANIPQGEKNDTIRGGSAASPTQTVTNSAAPSRAEPVGAGDANQPKTPPSALFTGEGAITAGQSPRRTSGGVVSRMDGAAPGVVVGAGFEMKLPEVTTTAVGARGDTLGAEDDNVGGVARSTKVMEGPETVVGGTPSTVVSVSAAAAAADGGEVTQSEPFVLVQKEQREDELKCTPAAGENRRPVEGVHAPQLGSTTLSLEKRPGATAATAVVSPSVEASGLSVGGSVRERGIMPDDLGVANPDSVTPQPRTTATLVQAVLATDTAQSITKNREGGVDFVGKSGVMKPSLEAITEAPGEESSGDGHSGSVRNGVTSAVSPSAAAAAAVVSALDMEYSDGAIRKPYCLSPTNVMRQVRGSSATAATGYCRERQLLAARIQLSAGEDAAAAAAAAATGVHTAPEASPSGLLSPKTSIAGSGFGGGLTTDGGGGSGERLTSATGGPAFHTDAENAHLLSEGVGASMSPYFSRGDDRCAPRSQSPPSRFQFPSSETKAAPLRSAGGSTSLYEGLAMNANNVRGGQEGGNFSSIRSEVVFFGDVGGGAQMTETGEVNQSGGLPSPAGGLRLDEEQLAVSFCRIAPI